jgi:endonuclease YncB( thermonuclease family)
MTATITVLVFTLAVLVSSSETLAASRSGGSGGKSSGYKSYRGAKAIDGDTFRYNGQRYRLRDYNAPEIGRPGSQNATQNLQKKLDSGHRYKPVAKDVYGRPLVEESGAK